MRAGQQPTETTKISQGRKQALALNQRGFMPRSTPSPIALLCVLAAASSAYGQAAPSDAQIVQEVKSTLAQEDALQGKGNYIFPTVHNGIVSLDGHVTSAAAKKLASAEVGDIKGVKTVLNNLTTGDVTATRETPSSPSQEAGTASAANGTVVRVISLAPHTVIPVRLDDEITTKTAKVGDTFRGTVPVTIYQTNYPMIPAGTPVLGRVTEAKAAGRLVGYALLTLELTSVRLPVPNGDPETAGIVTAPLSSKGNGRGTNTVEKTGGGAAIGGIIGALAGGGQGAAIGAASGGALGAGSNALVPGQQIDLKPETLLRFANTEPLPVHIELRNGYPVIHPAATSPALSTREQTSQNAPPS